jgi:hypothetical protein
VNTKRQYRPPTICDLFTDRYAILQPLIWYANQKRPTFICTNDRALLCEFVDFINTDDGKRHVATWYNESFHTLGLLEHIARNLNTYDESLVSAGLHAASIEIDRIITRLIVTTHTS